MSQQQPQTVSPRSRHGVAMPSGSYSPANYVGDPRSGDFIDWGGEFLSKGLPPPAESDAEGNPTMLFGRSTGFGKSADLPGVNPMSVAAEPAGTSAITGEDPYEGSHAASPPPKAPNGRGQPAPAGVPPAKMAGDRNLTGMPFFTELAPMFAPMTPGSGGGRTAGGGYVEPDGTEAPRAPKAAPPKAPDPAQPMAASMSFEWEAALHAMMQGDGVAMYGFAGESGVSSVDGRGTGGKPFTYGEDDEQDAPAPQVAPPQPSQKSMVGDLVKAGQARGGKYKARRPDGRGGWVYTYDHPAGHEMRVRVGDSTYREPDEQGNRKIATAHVVDSLGGLDSRKVAHLHEHPETGAQRVYHSGGGAGGGADAHEQKALSHALKEHRKGEYGSSPFEASRAKAARAKEKASAHVSNPKSQFGGGASWKSGHDHEQIAHQYIRRAHEDPANADAHHRAVSKHYDLAAKHFGRVVKEKKKADESWRDPPDAQREREAKRGVQVTTAGPSAPSSKKVEKSMPLERDVHGRAQLRKGLYMFRNCKGDEKLPEQYLYDYLCSAIEQAYEEESREPAHQNLEARAQLQALSSAVLGAIVGLLPSNANLKRACLKYKVTKDVVARILVQKGLFAPKTDSGWTSDEDSLRAMGVDSLRLSLKPFVLGHDADPGHRPGTMVVRPAEANVMHLLKSDDGDPHLAFRGHAARAQESLWQLPEAPALAPLPDCPVHTGLDMTKSQTLYKPNLPCTCSGAPNPWG